MHMKQVIVLRGISGSGKSTYARTLVEGVEGAVIVSSDSYFEREDGTYAFEHAKLGEAHGACFRAFIAAAQVGAPLIVVDNTNSRMVEAAPYMLGARAYGYEAKIVEVECDLIEALQRGTHGVPQSIVVEMAGRIKFEKAPPWWTSELVKT